MGRRRAPVGELRPPSPSGRAGAAPRTPGPPPRERFLHLDAARARREWDRLSGTAQRDLFRQLRNRFLARHAVPGGWSADIGSGPGRFARFVGGDPARRILVDLSLEMLRESRVRQTGASAAGPGAHLIRADGLIPPIRPGRLTEVVLLGNSLGFQGEASEALLARCAELVAPGGTLLLESAPGPGERSTHLARLPAGALVRFLRSPRSWAAARVTEAGFLVRPARARASPPAFRRLSSEELLGALAGLGFEVREVSSVAPCLGGEGARLSEVHADPRAWSGLLALEEAVGAQPARWPRAAALLIAAVRTRGEGVRAPAGRPEAHN